MKYHDSDREVKDLEEDYPVLDDYFNTPTPKWSDETRLNCENICGLTTAKTCKNSYCYFNRNHKGPSKKKPFSARGKYFREKKPYDGERKPRREQAHQSKTYQAEHSSEYPKKKVRTDRGDYKPHADKPRQPFQKKYPRRNESAR